VAKAHVTREDERSRRAAATRRAETFRDIGNLQGDLRRVISRSRLTVT
jgi:hypothetical protein